MNRYTSQIKLIPSRDKMFQLLLVGSPAPGYNKYMRTWDALPARLYFPKANIAFLFIFSLNIHSGVLVDFSSNWNYLKGSNFNTLHTGQWRKPSYNDASWTKGAAPFRYGDFEGGTLLKDMKGAYTTLYLRKKIQINTWAGLDELLVSLRFDDGVRVWINDKPVVSENAPVKEGPTAVALGQHESGTVEFKTIEKPGEYFVIGENTIAALGYNVNPTSSDFYLDLKLEGRWVLPASEQVVFSHPRGFYSAPFTLALASSEPNAKVYYTTNNDAPDSISGKLYAAPLRIQSTTVVRAVACEPGKAPSVSMSHSYIFITDVMSQGNHAPSGEGVFWDTEMDPDVVNDTRYHSKMEASLKSIPSVSVSINHAHLFGPEGIHRGANLEEDIEFGASAELIYPQGDYPGFQINCALKLQGGANRWNGGERDSKQSFSLKFKPPYGPSKLKYPAMESTPINKDWQVREFNRLILRSSFNADFANAYPRSQRANTVLIRDQWGRGSQTAMSGIGSQGTFVHLYLNGLYWGLFNLIERPDHHLSAIHSGGNDEDWFAWKNKEDVLSGDIARFKATRASIVKSGDLAAIRQHINTAAYWDWVLLGFYAAVADLQWYVGNRMSPTGPILYYVWDFEDSWGIGPRTHPGARIQFHGYAKIPQEKTFFKDMLAHSDLKLEFADRVYENCFNGGALSDSASQKRWMDLADFIEEAVIAEYARWGDTREPADPLTRDDHWYKARDRVVNMMQGNSAKLVSLLKQNNYYPALDPPIISPHGGLFTKRTAVALQNPNLDGVIVYTLDGSDPRVQGGAQRNGTQPSDAPFQIGKTSVLKARVKQGNAWSALAKAAFYLPTNYGLLSITEIMYHPADGKEFEFIELKNTGPETLPLAGCKIKGDVYYPFPPETVIPAGDFLVVTADSLTFRLIHPKVAIAGDFVRNLPNKGGKIELVAPDGERIQHVVYDDKSPWSKTADGKGYSLILKKTQAGQKDLSNAYLWAASARTGGSPGAEDPNSMGIESAHRLVMSILNQNRPNPFRYHTRISFFLPGHLISQSEKGKISLCILDVKGRTIQSNTWRETLPGQYHYDWNGSDAKGIPVPAGLYIYRLSLGKGLDISKSMIRLP